MRAHHRARSRRLVTLAAFAALAVAALPRAGAQTPASAPAGSVGGVVRDAAGTPLADVTVTLGRARAVTGAQGRFHLDGLPAGDATLELRRLGYRMQRRPVTIVAGQTASLAVTLVRVPQELAPVVVEARRDLQMRQLAGFYERRRQGFGRFITREQIEARNTNSFTDLLRTMIPGVRVVSGRYVSSSVRLRANTCPPLVVLDGFPAAAAEFDLGAIDPLSVMGIEVYSGPATVPVEFRTPRGLEACGVVAIWSGIPRRRPRPRMTDAEVRKVLDSLTADTAPRVFAAEDVESPAHVDSTGLVSPIFPESLYARGVGGAVRAAFVIDTTGLVVPATFGADSSSHPLFTEAVRIAVLASRFQPARHQGRAVRQVMVLPFEFRVEGARERR